MDEDLKTYLEEMKRELREHAEEMKRELREHTEAVETRLLLEFWKWARQADARYRQHHSSRARRARNAGRGSHHSCREGGAPG